MKYNFEITTQMLEDDPNTVGRRNHGARWVPDHFTQLHHWWNACPGMSFQEICDAMGRSYSAVAAKLSERGYVRYDPTTGCYCGNRPSNPQPTTTKEETMNNATIETKTFIAGIDATTLSDEQIFKHIAKLEGEVDKLKAIRTVSKKLQAAIAKMEEDLVALVDYVDNRV